MQVLFTASDGQVHSSDTNTPVEAAPQAVGELPNPVRLSSHPPILHDRVLQHHTHLRVPLPQHTALIDVSCKCNGCRELLPVSATSSPISAYTQPASQLHSIR